MPPTGQRPPSPLKGGPLPCRNGSPKMKLSSPSFAAVPSSSLGRPRCARPRRRRPRPPRGRPGLLPPRRLRRRRRAAPGSFPNRAPCGPPPHPRSGNAAHPGGAGLFIALPRRPRAHLGAALYSAFLASLLKNETPDLLGNDTRIAPPKSPQRTPRPPCSFLRPRVSFYCFIFRSRPVSI